jgi:hypothetical protein
MTQAARQLPTPADLPPAARRRLEQLPPDLRDIVASCYPTDAAEMAAQRDEEERQRAKLKQERAELLELADKAEEGKCGPEGKELALELLDGSRGGRSDFNLGCLRTAIRRLK